MFTNLLQAARRAGRAAGRSPETDAGDRPFDYGEEGAARWAWLQGFGAGRIEMIERHEAKTGGII